MTQAKLAFLIATPSYQLLRILQQDQISVLSRNHLLAVYAALLVLMIDGELKVNLCNFRRVFYYNLIV